MSGPVTHTLFHTAIGRMAIAWTGETVVATHLPEDDDKALAARIETRARSQGEAPPPPAIEATITAIKRLIDGGRIDLRTVRVSYGAAPELDRRVWDLTRAIPQGETRTYGEIAIDLGDRLLAQAVGRALGANPLPVIVPCHRIMGAGGKLTGFSANGGIETKLKLLGIERAAVGSAPGLFGDLPLAVKPRR